MSGDPITTWAEVASTLGLSYDTILRRRKARGALADEPHFRDADEVWAWWRSLKAAPSPPPARRRARAETTPGRLDAPLDPVALARTLTRG